METLGSHGHADLVCSLLGGQAWVEAELAGQDIHVATCFARRPCDRHKGKPEASTGLDLLKVVLFFF